MTDSIALSVPIRRPDLSEARLRRRYAAERRFRLYGLAAIGLAVLMLGILLVSIISKGYGTFVQTQIGLDIKFDAATIDPAGTHDPATLAAADYSKLVKDALQARFPEATGRQDKRALNELVSSGAALTLRAMVMADPTLIGTTKTVWLTADDNVDMLNKGNMARGGAEAERQLNDKQVGWFDALAADGRVK